MFIKPLREHVVHKKVYLIYRVKLLYIASILILTNLCVVSKPSFPNVKILDNIIKGPLLPSILNIPIEFAIGSLLDLLLVLETVGVCAIFAKLTCVPSEVFPRGATTCRAGVGD